MAKNQYNPYAEEDADPYDYDYEPFSASRASQNVTGQMNTQGLPQFNPPQQPMQSTNPYSKQSATTSYGSASSPQQDESMRLKAMELARREAEIERRERELHDVEGSIAQQPKKNWPICKPFLYHNIKEEVPPGIRRTACYMGYIGWFIFSVVLVLNFAGALLTMFSKAKEKSGIERVIDRVKFVVFAGIYVLIGVPGHFILSYWPLYKAMSTAAIGRFTLFFIGYAVPIVFCAFCVSGWSDYGPCGIVVAILYFPLSSGAGNVAAFVYNLVMAVIWGAMVLYFVIIYIMAIRVFRQENHSLKKASDFAQNSVMGVVTRAAVSNVFGGSTNADNA